MKKIPLFTARKEFFTQFLPHVLIVNPLQVPNKIREEMIKRPNLVIVDGETTPESLEKVSKEILEWIEKGEMDTSFAMYAYKGKIIGGCISVNDVNSLRELIAKQNEEEG